jgi:hypothetical protein
MKKKGVSLIELLMACLVSTLGVVGLFSSWTFCSSIILSQRTTTVAYQLARANLEDAKVLGFPNLPLGTLDVARTQATLTDSPVYFDADGNKLGGSSGAYYSVVRQTVDKNISVSGSTYTLSGKSIRAVTVTVKRVGSNESILTMGTNLAKDGV